MRPVRVLLAALTLLLGTVAVAPPAQAICGAAEVARMQVDHENTSTGDTVEVQANFYDCGNYAQIRKYKYERIDGLNIDYFYEADLHFYSYGTSPAYSRVNFTLTENVYYDNADFRCYEPCRFTESGPTRTSIPSWPDGYLVVKSAYTPS